MNKILRPEYPRPQFERKAWMSLNGIWDFSFEKEIYDQTICVPFAYESKLSGIGKRDLFETVWYRRYFPVPREWAGKRIILHFGAVDYECKVWVNHQLVTSHVGGQTSFSVDISDYLVPDDNELRICVKDYHKELDIPRGKQFWKEESRSIFYTPTTGIWQSVWLEPVSEKFIRQVFVTPLFDEKSVKFEYETENSIGCTLETKITYEGKLVSETAVLVQKAKGTHTVTLDEAVVGCWNMVEDLAWTPEQPRLFDVEYSLKDTDNLLDEVQSYFGMRKISVENGRFLLNNRPYFQKLLLDQGYWPDGLMTAPSDEDFVNDIILAKKMGFNGVRKHQKVEDPRFLYHADRLGFLVWGEIGAGYAYSRRLVADMMQEWMDTVARDYNHPCIVVWTPLNESWGVSEISQSTEQQHFCRALYAVTKAIDTTRLVVDNDGWEHVESDLLTIHDYESDGEILSKRYAGMEHILNDRPAGRALYVKGGQYHNEPVIISEFGGISFEKNGAKGWGYSNASSEEDFLKRYREVVTPLLQSGNIQGFCYTQLTDVEQEINGLLTYDRKPKADLEEIKRITCGNVK
ncbi:MAG TPA: glycoside hydrolase family 2 [Clostridiales bacterium]|nr:glycoside hydrolase family 2 [Clostridiales bacterium]